MSVDLRGFVYALEPMRRLRQWQLDALLQQLGRLQGEVQEAGAFVEELRALHMAKRQEVTRNLEGHGTQPLDPVRHAQAVAYLAQLESRIQKAEQHLEALQAERDLSRRQCLVQQQKVDVIRLHREEAIEAFTRTELGRSASEADREWLARSVAERWMRRGTAARREANAAWATREGGA